MKATQARFLAEKHHNSLKEPNSILKQIEQKASMGNKFIHIDGEIETAAKEFLKELGYKVLTLGHMGRVTHTLIEW